MNYNLNNLLLLISTSLNFIFLLLVVLVIFKKGGINYLKSKVLTMGKINIQSDLNINSYYKHKKSQFEILPKSNDSILFLGDSLTDEGEWVELLGNTNIVNRGISGDTTRRILNRLDVIIQTKPKQIFLMVGINDFVNEKKSIEEVLGKYKMILEELQKQIPHTEVFIQSVLPVNNNLTYFLQDNENVIKFNLKLQALAKEFHYQYIDVFSYLADSENQLDVKYTTDGVHLNGKAYLIWKEAVEKYVAVN
ncbi:GDSL-type esterase/lipase family protein [Calothrix sp. CCY 0018]|uniref:GDSL-type esterase/lipase family protein n=1 Tax=Calothrix sp. CCY 0018 TaxID=3103864 RepID=UPI0039C73497